MNLMTADEVSQYLRMPKPTVYFHTKQGLIPSIKIGGRIRYSLVDIEQILRHGVASHEKVDGGEEDVPEFLNVKVTQDDMVGVNPVESVSGNQIVFAGLEGDDPALQVWIQWCIKRRLNPVVVPLQQWAQFANLSPKIIFIDVVSWEKLPEQNRTQTLGLISGDHVQRAKVVFLHEPSAGSELVGAVLRRGPAILCPKNPDQDSLNQIEAFFFDGMRFAELRGGQA